LSSRSRSHQRVSFSNIEEALELPDLIAVQRDSFKWFLEEGLSETFRDLSPITDFSGALRLELIFDPMNNPDHLGTPKFTEKSCREENLTFSAPIFVSAEFQNANTGEIKEQMIFLGDFPMMTEKGTFIINGTERVVVSQLVRSPGVIFARGKEAKTEFTGTIHPYRGEWIEFDVENKPGKDVTAGTRVARKRRLSLFILLRALGILEEQHIEKFVRHFDFLEAQWLKEQHIAPSQDEALLEIYKRARPGEPLNVEQARQYFEGAFFNPKKYDLTRVGRYKLNRKLGPEIDRMSEILGLKLEHPEEHQGTLAPAEILAASTYLLHLTKHMKEEQTTWRTDDQDHFSNRRIRSVGELIQNQVRVGLSRMERVVRERMSTQDEEAITPGSLVNNRPVSAAVKEFFGTSQLSQFMDQNNPLSGLAHKRRLSALGPGGLSRERAGFEVRDVHPSHYGRMCPIETPEGPNIGLIGSLATYARVNDHGFIETPYRRVVNGKITSEIMYLEADDEEEHVIAQANVAVDANGKITEDRVLARRAEKGGNTRNVGARGLAPVLVPPSEVDLMDVSPKQIISISTALIPFVEHDDANRALMGANMQKQAVPLVVPEAPYVGTGVEARAARDAGDVVLAEGDGTVTFVGGRKVMVNDKEELLSVIEVDYKPGQKDRLGRTLDKKVYELLKFERSNQNTCINQRPLVSVGEQVVHGDVLADGPATHNGELALGKNLLVAFMPWEGYNYEDAIILSERLVRDDVLTSIHIEEHEIDARDTKLGEEEITRDIPNLSEDILADLDDRGIIRVGAEVGPGDVLVGKVTPKGETEQTPEERLLRAIFGEKAREVRDTSLKVPHGESGKVIGIRQYARKNEDELPAGVIEMVRVYVAQRRKISEGDKLAGRHGNKGVISKILPVEDMPFLADGTPVDIILNPLGVPSRMNVGQVLESHLGYAARYGWKGVDASAEVGTSGVGDHASRKTRPRTEPAVWVSTPSFDGAHWDEEDQAGKHPTIKQIFGDLNADSANGNVQIQNDGKVTLYDGRTGLAYDNPISVGFVYILKLAHLVDDKIHARSTGPYSMITQQPLGGKAQFGGQRFGEMEVWALEAYGSAYALQELLTIKSDDVLGRVKVYEAIVKGENIPEPGIPESFKVLIKEMQSLCLDVEVLNDEGGAIEMGEIDEDVFRTAEELGIDISRPERGSDEEDLMRGAARS